MTSKFLLGEIEAILESDRGIAVVAGEHLHLEVENSGESGPAVRVETDRGETVGYLGGQLAAWVAPLMNGQQVHFDATVVRPPQVNVSATRLALIAWATPAGRAILQRRTPHSILDALHELVRAVYVECQSYGDAQLLLGVCHRLEPLACGELHPETQLLLALMPGFANELAAAAKFRQFNRE